VLQLFVYLFYKVHTFIFRELNHKRSAQRLYFRSPDRLTHDIALASIIRFHYLVLVDSLCHRGVDFYCEGHNYIQENHHRYKPENYKVPSHISTLGDILVDLGYYKPIIYDHQRV